MIFSNLYQFVVARCYTSYGNHTACVFGIIVSVNGRLFNLSGYDKPAFLLKGRSARTGLRSFHKPCPGLTRSIIFPSGFAVSTVAMQVVERNFELIQ